MPGFNLDFEPIYAALTALMLSTGDYPTWNATSSRLLLHWSDVPPAQQPAMFMVQGSETQDKRTGQLGKWMLDTTIWIYAQAPDDRTPAAPILNRLLKNIRNILGPDNSGPGYAQARQTLGGLVFDIWIAGKIETDDGYLGQQAVAKIPIRIIANGP